VESILKQLVGRVAEAVDVDMRAISTSNGGFHRSRVKLNSSGNIPSIDIPGGYY